MTPPKWTPYVFLTFVAACLLYAFSHRVGPPLPETQVRITDTTILNATVSGDVQLAVGERGRIFRRAGTDAPWLPVTSPTESTLTQVRFVDDQRVLAVGHDAVILLSLDAGQTWRKIYEDIEAESPLFDVLALTPTHWAAVGAYGTFLESRDAGANWSSRPISELDWHYNSLTSLDAQTFLIAGEAGTVLRSVDTGETWSVVPTPYNGSYFGSLALSTTDVIIFGMRGHVLRSSDAGQTFVEVPQPIPASLFGGHRAADGTLFLVGQNGMLLTSRDQAQTFTARQLQGNPMLTSVLPQGAAVLTFGQGGLFRTAAQ